MTAVGENSAFHNKEQGVEVILSGISTVKQTTETYDLVIIGGVPQACRLEFMQHGQT